MNDVLDFNMQQIIILTHSPLYRPKPPSSIAPLTGRNRPTGGPLKPCCLDKSIPCAHKTMTLHTMTLSNMTFTNNFCACQSSPFTDIRLIRSVFVEFITPFFHVLRCFNGCVAAMGTRLGTRRFCGRFVIVGFGKTNILR